MSGDSRFPDSFVWGAATSAYQIEGSPLADGAGPSNWHRFSHTPGRTLSGAGADVACDHYRRWSSDVDLIRELGLQSYRLSLSWSRILPEGRGRVNPAGLDFYTRLIDRLLAAGIMPNVTLYHWDLPAALEDRGGWLNPDIEGWFADYAEVVFKALADRVPMWSTLNEPWVIAHDGYLLGGNAPGHRDLFEAPRVSHHLLLAHAAAVERYRGIGKHKIGVVVNLEPKDSASDSPEDVAATRRAHVYFNEQYLDPLFLGRYPADLPALFGEAWPEHDPDEVARIAQPVDFLGINYYTRKVEKNDPAVVPTRSSGVRVPGATYTETGWEMHAPSLTRLLLWVRERYGDVPLYITENGAAIADPPTAEGGVLDDPLRVQYLHDHLQACHEAIRQGVDLRGYYAWSLMDNLEWSSGFSKRFGLIHVNFDTLERTIKRSGHWYRDVIRSNGAALDEAIRIG